MSKKQEVKTDWNKVPTITKVLTLIAALSFIFIFVSAIIGVWVSAFPAFKCIFTGVIVLVVSGWLVRTDVLDEDGVIKDKYKKNEL